MDDSDKEVVASLVKASYFGQRERRNHFMLRHTKYDRNARATELVLGTTGASKFWDLPVDIGRLSMLRKLELRYCRCIPSSLGSLKRLESVVLIQFDGKTRLLDPQLDNTTLNFPETKSLEIRGGFWNEQSMTRFMGWITRAGNFPKLADLRFIHLESEILSVVLDALSMQSNTSSILNLTRLQLDFSGMSDQQLQRLLFAILPHFPNLTSLSVKGNQIRSLQFLQNFFEGKPCDFTSRLLSSSLRSLSFDHNPILKHKNKMEETKAFVVLLRDCFPLLESLLTWGDWDQEIECWLRINRGRRILFMGKCTTTSTQTPVSLWPKVLEKACRTSPRGVKTEKEDATVVFHLLRNGPMVFERLTASSDFKG
ncbi:hypothetical protein IV203_031133 [Nitzschia inconspicua]|uniref:Uncharacterized protein n=1 Tax=Nitzschia inconspicua TaxID=303405 RepID=A0A9K3LTQ7_9STRA|nr:hypothetical protein IV203_031133 [Nitzschia inconspicua]